MFRLFLQAIWHLTLKTYAVPLDLSESIDFSSSTHSSIYEIEALIYLQY